jgi:cytochrome c oxidase subunit 3
VAFFWAYFNARFFPVGGVWPPQGIVPLDPMSLPFLNTLILLLSGTTVTWAHHALLHGDRQGLRQGLLYTVLLGTLFLGLQAYEYSHATFGFRDGIYASNFYMATGFHGFHVLIGTLFLLVCYLRARSGQFTEKHHVGFEAAAWYWHFVDVVWLFLFASVYLGG